MSSRTETIRIRTWPRLPRARWLIPGMLAALLAAGVASYIALRSDTRSPAPAITQTAPGPARVQPAQPLQPAAVPAGAQIAEVRGIDGQLGTTVARPAPEASAPAIGKETGRSTPAKEWHCSLLKRGPC